MTDDLLQQTLAEMERRLADAREEVGVSPSRFGAGGSDRDEVLETAVDLSPKAEREAADDVIDTIRKTPDIRSRVCAALESVANDSFEIVKELLPVMSQLNAMGYPVMPAAPAVLAVTGIILARGGLRLLCTEA